MPATIVRLPHRRPEGWASVLGSVAVAVFAAAALPGTAAAQGTAAQLLAELASGDDTRCMDAGNATSEHQEHYQPLAAELAPALVAMVEEGAPCAGSAIQALVNLGPGIAEGVPAARAVPVFAAIVEREIPLEYTDDAGSVASLIGYYGAEAAAAVPVLERFLRERAGIPGQYHDRSSVVLALGALGDAAAPAAPALVELLAPVPADDEEAWQKEELRVDALRALGQIPAAIDASGPHLARALLHDDGRVSWVARDALTSIGPGAVPHLVPLLGQCGAEACELVLAVLTTIGPGAAEAAPALLRLVGDESWSVRHAAGRALVAIGPTPGVVGGLAKLVEGSAEGAATLAAETLGELGPDASAALPALRKAASHESWQVKIAAEVAIERIAGTGPGS